VAEWGKGGGVRKAVQARRYGKVSCPSIRIAVTAGLHRLPFLSIERRNGVRERIRIGEIERKS